MMPWQTPDLIDVVKIISTGTYKGNFMEVTKIFSKVAGTIIITKLIHARSLPYFFRLRFKLIGIKLIDEVFSKRWERDTTSSASYGLIATTNICIENNGVKCKSSCSRSDRGHRWLQFGATGRPCPSKPCSNLSAQTEK